MGDESPKIQVAALPFRKRGSGIDILLITSRQTKRWIIPKGWPMPGLRNFTSAKREAFEEAGIVGRVSRLAIGKFSYSKRLKDETVIACEVLVFPVQVQSLTRNWKEKHERTRKWFNVEQAAQLVQELDLKEIIRTLS